MARVFVAEETSLGRKVVVKLLPPELAAEVSVERFRREIQFAAQLQHPLIVPVLSATQQGALLYYTMPFVAGESLRARLHRDGALPLGDALRIWRDLATALAVAHGPGVIHRTRTGRAARAARWSRTSGLIGRSTQPSARTG